MTKWLAAKGCKIPLIDNLGQSCLFYVARDGCNALAECLIELSVDINSVDTYGQTAFFYACREGHLEICRLLSECGTEVDLSDTTAGETPLYYAIKNNQKHIVSFLIERGVNVNHRNHKQLSPYVLAKRTNGLDPAILQMLVQAGSKIQEEDYSLIGAVAAGYNNGNSYTSQTGSSRKKQALNSGASLSLDTMATGGAPGKNGQGVKEIGNYGVKR